MMNDGGWPVTYANAQQTADFFVTRIDREADNLCSPVKHDENVEGK